MISNDVIYEIRRIINNQTIAKRGNVINICIRSLEWLLGGTVTHHYNEINKKHYFILVNDDINDMVFDVCVDAFKYEPLDVRISRMCEEYDGYMRYKYRDYEEKYHDNNK